MASQRTVTSFRASDVAAGALRPILNNYLALEQLKAFRRLLVMRIGQVALCAGMRTYASGIISPLGSLVVAAGLMTVPGAAWLAELRAEARLARRLPGVTREKVIKSS